MSQSDVRAAVPNGISVPDMDLPVRDNFPSRYSRFTLRSQYPDSPEVITANVLKLTELTPDPYGHSTYLFLFLYIEGTRAGA